MRKLDSYRFWKNVEFGQGCWEWTAGRSSSGYGQFSIKNRNCSPHRFSWTLHYGPIPDGMQVLHKCDNPPCVRPDHLFIGTVQDNVDDMIRKGRRTAYRRGSNNPHSKLTEYQVRTIKELANSGTMTDRDIATRFGVHLTTINGIKLGHQWRHL